MTGWEPQDFSTIDLLDDRDYLLELELDFDVDSQLRAIAELLQSNRNSDQTISDEIKKAEVHCARSNGVENEHAVDEWLDLLHHSTYQAAAQSMSAVGMLAPFIETVFYQCFQGIGKRFYPAAHSHKTHDRWNSAHRGGWDCHFVFMNGKTSKDLVKGILQLSDALGLTERFPADLKEVLAALFAYRNAMFHHGFEWPVEERERFAKRTSEEWPKDWFSVATAGDKPWIFFLSDKFLQHCIVTMEKVLQAIGGFIRNEMLPLESRGHEL